MIRTVKISANDYCTFENDMPESSSIFFSDLACVRKQLASAHVLGFV